MRGTTFLKYRVGRQRQLVCIFIVRPADLDIILRVDNKMLLQCCLTISLLRRCNAHPLTPILLAGIVLLLARCHAIRCIPESSLISSLWLNHQLLHDPKSLFYPPNHSIQSTKHDSSSQLRLLTNIHTTPMWRCSIMPRLGGSTILSRQL